MPRIRLILRKARAKYFTLHKCRQRNKAPNPNSLQTSKLLLSRALPEPKKPLDYQTWVPPMLRNQQNNVTRLTTPPNQAPSHIAINFNHEEASTSTSQFPTCCFTSLMELSGHRWSLNWIKHCHTYFPSYLSSSCSRISPMVSSSPSHSLDPFLSSVEKKLLQSIGLTSG